MKCDKCKLNFEEKDIEESHDIPTYFFQGTRRERKQLADKYGRHWLCRKCHDKYERTILARCFIFIYKKLIAFPDGRTDLIPYMTVINKERDEIKKARFWGIAKEVREEFF